MTMKLALVIGAVALVIGWLPLAWKFYQSWKIRKNPVSLAICLVMLVFAYQNLMFMLATLGETTWRVYAIATRAFEVATIVNFFVAFRWSDTRFAGARRTDADQPPAA